MRKEKVKKEVAEKIEEEIIGKKKMFEEVKLLIINKLMINFSVALVVILYWLLLIIGKMYLDRNVFIITSQLSNFALLLLTIFLIEIAYRKEDGNLGIHGIEMFILSICALFVPYAYYEMGNTIKIYISLVGVSMGVYYLIKGVVIYILEKRKYIKSQSEISKMIKKGKKKKKEQEEIIIDVKKEEKPKTNKKKEEKQKKKKEIAKKVEKSKKEEIKEVVEKVKEKEEIKIEDIKLGDTNGERRKRRTAKKDTEKEVVKKKKVEEKKKVEVKKEIKEEKPKQEKKSTKKEVKTATTTSKRAGGKRYK